MFDFDDKNFLENVINNYIQMTLPENINFAVKQIADLLNEKKGKVEEKNWFAYFDLLIFSNNRTKFDKATELYAKVLQKSPPSWREIQYSSNFEETNLIKISNLSTLSAARIKDFIDIVKQGNSYSRIDFSNTQFETDEGDLSLSGVEVLKNLFYEIKGCKCQIIGQINLVKYLEKKIETDYNDLPEDFWLLLLEVYQCLGNVNAYENLAFQYIEKFEKSVLDFNKKHVLIIEEEKKNENFILSIDVEKTEIVQLSYELSEKLNQAQQNKIEIDFEKVQLIRYSALEELSKFILEHADLLKEKDLIFKNVNQVTYTSLEIMGIDFDLVQCKMIKY